MNSIKLIFSFLLIAVSSYGQITSDLTPVPGESLGYMYVHADTLQPRSPGQPFYNFVVADSVPISLNYVLPASTPFDDSITDASKNLSVKIGSGYSYYTTDASEWSVVGYASSNFALTYSKHLPLFVYPLFDGSTYGDSASAIFSNAGIETHRTASISAVVDADAFLQVNDTLENNLVSGPCLRLHVTEVYNDATYVNSTFYKSYQTTVESFYWLDKDPNIIAFSYQTISFNDLATPTNNTLRAIARYRQ